MKKILALLALCVLAGFTSPAQLTPKTLLSWQPLTNQSVTVIFNGQLQTYTLTNSPVTFTFVGSAGSVSYRCKNITINTVTGFKWLAGSNSVCADGVISFTAYGSEIVAAMKELQ